MVNFLWTNRGPYIRHGVYLKISPWLRLGVVGWLKCFSLTCWLDGEYGMTV